jgi:hypothetical protein
MANPNQIHLDAANAAILTLDNLEAERTSTRPLYLLKILESSDLAAKNRVHAEAEPYIARKMKNEVRKLFTASMKDNKEEYADALTDEDFSIVFRGGMGFAVNSPKNLYDVLCCVPSFMIDVTSSTNIKYKLQFAKYSGKAIMKTKDTEERHFAFGEIPPTAMQHTLTTNTVDAVRICYKNAIISGGMIPGNIEPRMNAAGTMTNQWRIEWTMPLNLDEMFRFKLYKAYKVPLPSGDEGSMRFSGEFCKKFNLHMKCGRPNKPVCDYLPAECSMCNPTKDSGKAKVAKRSFDAMFGDLN